MINFMSGGLDILIVGIADESLDSVASEERLRKLFDMRTNTEASANRYYEAFHALVDDPSTKNLKIFYLAGEHMMGAQIGAGLGYVIFDGNNNSPPKKIDERVFKRIEELKKRFVEETNKKGVKVPTERVGVYALNVRDT